MNQAIIFCLRKADLNNDSSMSFDEFKAFMLFLRKNPQCTDSAHLIFSLFDLDSSNKIEKPEFRELYRFFLGHNPTDDEFEKEWARLDVSGAQRATRSDYIRWLQTSTNPIFKQHAPTVDGTAASDKTVGSPGFRKAKLPGLTRTLSSPSSIDMRPSWNERFTAGVNMDPKTKCMQQVVARRSYFSRPQSLPELARHYETHRGFKLHAQKLSEPEAPKERPVVSTEKVGQLSGERGKPGGSMRNTKTGQTEKWEDFWQTPQCLKARYQPGSLDFRCPGMPPPSWSEDD
jgi:hypothetical protein